LSSKLTMSSAIELHNPNPDAGWHDTRLTGLSRKAAASYNATSALAAMVQQSIYPRILVIDDMPAIHEDFRKILIPARDQSPELAQLEAAFMGPRVARRRRTKFTIDGALRGEEGLAMVQESLAQGRPYVLAFVDVRMPSGWDGIETIARLRKVDPAIQVVICTAYSDYSWEQMVDRLGQTDGLLILKKPFDTLEVLQLAETLNQKWLLARQAKLHLADLDRMVNQRTQELSRANEDLAQEMGERSRTQIRLSAFSTLAYRLSAARTAKAAGQIIVDTAEQLLGWDACLVELYSPDTGMLTHVFHADLVDGQRKETLPGYLHRLPSPLARKIIQDGGLLILNEDSQQSQTARHRFGDIARASASIMYVPVRDGTAVTGVLSIQSYTSNAYDQRSLETLQILADHCGGAMDRIRSEEALNRAQEQLRQSQKLEAIGQLAGGVAHDFNNLLAVIRGNADLAQMLGKGLSAEIAECLSQIIGASERAANLTRQLLAFSRKQRMQSHPANLNDVMMNFTKMLQRIIGEHIDLQCRFTAGLPPVQADVGMIEQVLANLVVNARDAMPQGGRLLLTSEEVTLEEGAFSHPEARAGRFVCMAVKDTGAGIAPDDLPHIFEPFFTTKESGKGTGLGLATVYGIVKQHQGWIEVSSQMGLGSTFKLFLPALRGDIAPIHRHPPELQPRGGKETILLVEDEEAVRVVTHSLLERSGYRVLEATSGRDAFKVWQESGNRVDLLLTDVIMPDGISGCKLARELRTLYPALKIIFVTGYSGEVIGSDTDHLRQANSYFLQKPCPPHELLAAVRRCLDGLPPLEINALLPAEEN
jgi:two-component system, cell cycle sensor histidine kinase and response regulator CckA